MLTGGLGNQLFQLAFGLSATRDKLVLDSLSGNPRVSKSGCADILDYTLPDKVTTSTKKQSRFISRVVGYNLRNGILRKRLNRTRIFNIFLSMISSTILSIYFREVLGLISANGVGYDGSLNKIHKNRYLVGYFQSYKWLSPETKNMMRALELKSPSLEFTQLLETIASQNPIIIHLRLGDYLQEPKFGTPSIKYYEDGLNLLLESLPARSIFGFSDQPDLAKDFFAYSKFSDQITWVDDSQLSSCESLELMRCGSAYVIANSTFSWWAATLCRNENPQVVSPQPWFKSLEEPRLLCPENWIRIKAYY